MRELDVVSVGEALVDMVAPDAPDLRSAARFIPVPGGAPANIAAAVARLGGRAALIGTVGDDPFGTFLLDALRDSGVQIDGVTRVSLRTSLSFVARNAGGIPDFLFYREADAVLAPDDIPAPLIEHANILYVTSMPFLTSPTREATVHAMQLARQAGTLVAADPNFRPSSWPSLQAARDGIAPLLDIDIFKVNDEEGRLLTGKRDLESVLAHLPATLALITLGQQGVLWRFKGRSGRVPAPCVNVVDTTGAGDAFMGAALTEIARRVGNDLAALSEPELLASLQIATVAGSYACTRLGALPSLPTRADLAALLGATTSPTPPAAGSASRPPDSARRSV